MPACPGLVFCRSAPRRVWVIGRRVGASAFSSGWGAPLMGPWSSRNFPQVNCEATAGAIRPFEAKAVELRAYDAIVRELASGGFAVSDLDQHARGADFSVFRKSKGLCIQLKACENKGKAAFRASREFWKYREHGCNVLLFALLESSGRYAFYFFDLSKKKAPRSLERRSYVGNVLKTFRADFHHYKVQSLSSALRALL